jgi:predicted Zn-dependent protease
MLDTIVKSFRTLRSPAPFWSLRYSEELSEALSVRQDVPQPPARSLDRGAMLTAAVEGGYGYAATSDLSPGGLQRALDRATAWAEAARGRSVVAIDPRRFGAPSGVRTPPAVSAPNWSRRELYDMLGAECRGAAIDARIVDRHVSLETVAAETLYLTNTGGEVRQSFRYIMPDISATANEGGETQSRSFSLLQQGGFERLAGSGFFGAGKRVADEALQLLLAPNCPSGRMDLLLMPDQMMLQIHESIGHPLELDRILGDERNYAGTSFVTPDMFGAYRYGSELLNVTYDPTRPEELASFSFDDEGTPAEKTHLIRDGVLERPLGGRLSQLRAGLPGVANARASSWNRPPIDRMANLNVEPGTGTLAGMIAGIERGILMRTNSSWSIDDSRNKFQFGCEWGERIENGRLAGVVKNPNYRGISATFWRSLDAVGEAATVEVTGTAYCGKGQPNQAIRVGHAAPACRFVGVDVFGGDG